MKLKDRMKIVSSLGRSTWLESEKDEAVRRIMQSDNRLAQISRMDMMAMCDFISTHYMMRKPGFRHWELDTGRPICSHCGMESNGGEYKAVKNGVVSVMLPNYCPFCGYKMDEEEEG